jgi:hypothetical protein
MKKVLSLMCLLGMLSSTVQAIGTGFTASDVSLVKANMDWTTIGSFSTKTSNNKLLTLLTTGECGIYTETNVSTQKGKKESVTATGAVYFRVLVNGVPSTPTQVTYCSRMQTLSAALQGIIDQCPVVDGVISTADCEYADESIGLILQTMDANSFVFAKPTTAGNVKIELQAKIVSSTDTGTNANSSANAWGSIGSIAVVAQQLNLSQQR